MKSSTKITLAVILSIILVLGILIGAYFLFIKQTVVPINIQGLVQHTNQGNPATINTGKYTFKFAVSLDSLAGSYVCDSRGNTCPIWQCAETITVYKNDVKIDTIKQGYAGDRASENSPTPPSRLKVYFDDGTICDDSNPTCFNQQKSGVKINPLTSSDFSSSSCHSVDNDLFFIAPNNSYDITLSPTQNSYIQGQNVSINVKVINNLNPSLATLILNYEVPTIIGTAIKQVSQDINLALGENNFVYSIPTDKSTVLLKVTPEIKIYYPQSYFSGISISPQFIGDKAGYILINDFTDKTQEIQIIPSPNTLNITCSNGLLCPNLYTCVNSVCIKTDIVNRTLTCFDVPAPNIAGHTYECTNAGIWAETLYKEALCKNDTDCNDPSLRCDPNSGYCIKTDVYNQVVQCSKNSDCLTQCSGVTSQCLSNKCIYSGSCQNTMFTCNPPLCPSGTICRQVTCPSSSTCQSDGSCLKIEKNIVNIIPSWITLLIWAGAIIIIILIVLIIFFIMRRK